MLVVGVGVRVMVFLTFFLFSRLFYFFRWLVIFTILVAIPFYPSFCILGI